MNIGELLGAGLLGGVGNAAKGAGDRLREEAKQKRDMALIDQEQVNAVALQATVAQDNIDLARAKGEISIDVGDAGSANNIAEADNDASNKSILMAEQGEITSALTSLQGAQAIKRDKLSIEQKGKLDTAAAALKAQTDLGSQAEAASLLAAQKAVDAIVAANVASQLAGTQAAAAAEAAGVAATAAKKLAGTQMKMAVYDTTTNKDVADALAVAQAKTAAKLGETRMAEITANNAAALAQIKAGTVGDVHSFYDETTGLEYKAVRNKDGGWDNQGGTKASTAPKNAYTLQNIQIEGVNVRGYMDGTTFVSVGTQYLIKIKKETGTSNKSLALLLLKVGKE